MRKILGIYFREFLTALDNTADVVHIQRDKTHLQAKLFDTLLVPSHKVPCKSKRVRLTGEKERARKRESARETDRKKTCRHTLKLAGTP
jgi:hypothetical protein